MESQVTWRSGLTFDVRQDGQTIVLDAGPGCAPSPGLRPKGLLLSGLGGCTGMDVVSILQKMKVPLEGLDIRVSAEVTDEHPKVFRHIHIRYIFKGKNLPLDKLERAVDLSRQQFCGVSAMLGKAAEISHEIVIEESPASA